jgi:hypothetical protein
MNEKLIRKIAALESRAPEPLDPGAAMESVLAQLQLIGTRRRAVTGWHEPTATERAAILRRVEAEAAAHGMTAV